MLANDLPRTIDLATRAVSIAREAGAQRALSHALNNLGTAHLLQNRDNGIDELVEAAEVAAAGNFMDDAARAHVNLVWTLLDQYRLGLAERYLAPALEFSERTEVVLLWIYQQVERARLHLARARGTRQSPPRGTLPNHNRSPIAPPSSWSAWSGSVGGTRVREPVLDEASRSRRPSSKTFERICLRRRTARGGPAARRPRGCAAIARPVYDEAARREELSTCRQDTPGCCG